MIALSFHIAKDIRIASHRMGYEPFTIRIASRTGEYGFTAGQLVSPGTVIVLRLNETGIKTDIAAAVEHFLRARPRSVSQVSWCSANATTVAEMEAFVDRMLAGETSIPWNEEKTWSWARSFGRFRSEKVPTGALDIGTLSPPSGCEGFVMRSKKVSAGVVICQEGIFVTDKVPGVDNLTAIRLSLNFPAGWLRLSASRTELVEGDRTSELRDWVRQTERGAIAIWARDDEEMSRKLWERSIVASEQPNSGTVDIGHNVIYTSKGSMRISELAGVREGTLLLSRSHKTVVDPCGQFSGASLYRTMHYDEQRMADILAHFGHFVVHVPIWRDEDREFNPEGILRAYLEERGKKVRAPEKDDVLSVASPLAPPAALAQADWTCRFLKLGGASRGYFGVNDEMWFDVDHPEGRRFHEAFTALGSLDAGTTGMLRIWTALHNFQFAQGATVCEDLIRGQLQSRGASIHRADTSQQLHLRDLATRLGVPPRQLIVDFMGMNELLSVNDVVPPALAERVAKKYGKDLGTASQHES